jgi:hypothetical protein
MGKDYTWTSIGQYQGSNYWLPKQSYSTHITSSRKLNEIMGNYANLRAFQMG